MECDKKIPVKSTIGAMATIQKESSINRSNGKTSKRGVVFQDSESDSDDASASKEKQQRLNSIDNVEKPSKNKNKIIPWKSLKRKQRKPGISKKKQKELMLEKEIAKIFDDGEMFGVNDERWEIKEDDPQWWAFPCNDLGTGHENSASLLENAISGQENSASLLQNAILSEDTNFSNQEMGQQEAQQNIASLPKYFEESVSVSSQNSPEVNVKNELVSYFEKETINVQQTISEQPTIDDRDLGIKSFNQNENFNDDDDNDNFNDDYDDDNDDNFNDDYDNNVDNFNDEFDDDYNHDEGGPDQDNVKTEEDRTSNDRKSNDRTSNVRTSKDRTSNDRASNVSSKTLGNADIKDNKVKNGFVRAASKPNLVPQDKTGKYICTICDKKFVRKHSVYGHKRTKHPEQFKQEKEQKDRVVVGNFKCKYCPKYYKCVTSVYAHKQTAHYEEYLKEKEARINSDNACDENSMECERKDTIIDKVSSETYESGDIQDSKTANGFIRATSRPNLVPQDKDGMYVCTICHKKFVRKPSVYGHKKSKHPEEFKLERQLKEQVIVGDYKCAYCPKHFKRLTSVYAHKQAFHYQEYMKEKEARINNVRNQQQVEGEEASLNINIDVGSVPRDSNGMFYCTVCKKKFKRNTSVYAHRRTFHPDVDFSLSKRNTDCIQKAFQCPYCPRSYAHLSGLTGHKSVEHPEEYNAEVAERNLARRKTIEARQMATAQGMKYLIKKRISVKGAKYPHRKISNRTGTIVSMLKRDEQNNYHCKFCDKRFSRKTSVLCHMKYTHPKQCHDMKEKLNKCKRYKCPHCSHTFDYRYSIYDHIKQKHPEVRKARREKLLRESQFLCKLCDDRPFTNYNQAFDHARSHHPSIHPRSDYIIQRSGPSLCPYCGMTFKYNIGLNSHIDNIHFQKKRFVCSVCGARYHTSSGVKKHELTHIGKASLYNCTYCQKGFKDKYRLEQHEMRHRGEYKFYCEMCSAGFMQKFKLEDHILMQHSDCGELPFKCDICGDGFKTRSQKQRHRKKVHKDVDEKMHVVFDADEYVEETVDKRDVLDGINLSLKPIINFEPENYLGEVMDNDN